MSLARGPEGEAPGTDPGPHDSEVVLPASAAQQRLWYIDGLRLGTPAYNIPAAFDLRGPLDGAALVSSFGELVRRHEALRTSFRSTLDGLQQVLAPDVAAAPARIVDLTGVAAGDRPARRGQVVRDFVRRVFDLGAAPLLDVCLLRWDREEHTLVVNVHHTVADGWSLSILLRELSALYAAAVGAEAPGLPPVELQYADYALWEQRRRDAGVPEAHVAYWLEALAAAPHAIELTADHPRPAVKSYEGAAEWLDLDLDSLTRLKAFARAQQVTPFQVVLAACAVVLGRYSRQDDLLIGTPMADRARPETESLVGFLVNTVVLRVDLSGDPTVTALLARIRAMAAGATAHQDLPFDRLVELLRPERDLSRTPVFQVMVTYQEDPLAALSLPGVAVTPVPVHNGTAKFDLLLGFEEHATGLRAMFEYSTDLFEAATIRRLTGHVRTALAVLVADPMRRISELPLLPLEERHQVVTAWNHSGSLRAGPACIHQYFHAQAERTPLAAAIVHGHQRISYRELRRRSGSLAAHLRSIGVGRGSLVGVCLERTPDMIAAVLAVLEAGGAYVPLDPDYPTERLRFILEDTAAEVVLTSERGRSVLPPHRGRIVDVSSVATDWEDGQRDDAADVSTNDLAYIIYTSGSTGRPKGVALEHRVATAMIRWAMDAFSSEELAGVLAATSICFDLSVFEMFVPLSCGGSIVLAQHALELPLLPSAATVSLINTVPSVMTELIRTAGLPAGLRVAILAGERLRPALVDEIHARSTIRRVVDVYGPSETSYTTAAERAAGSAETIGRPLPEVQTYVLDPWRNPVPIGVIGEIYIAGTTVARGYLNRPALTQERFIADPFGPTGGRMYASGDLARWRSDGNLEYFGRNDHQVKLRGYRIELGEVEAALRRHPEVSDAVAVVREDSVGDPRLVAYVVATPAGDDALALELRRRLQGELPAYMLPSAIVVLPHLPLTPNGKVDRRALPPPAGASTPTPVVAPRTATERRLAAIWSAVLQPVGEMSVDDDFFALGGHSLLAVRMFTSVQAEFGATLPLSTLFEAPTIARLSAVLDAGGPAEPAPRRGAGVSVETAAATSASSNRDRGVSLDAIRGSACLVAIHLEGTRPPLFVLPGAGGNILGFRAVARHLDPDQPLIGLESLGRDGKHVPLTSFEAIAGRFVAEIRAAQPHGPYSLAGVSFGGVVAFEVARQLRAAGERVALLALLDSGVAATQEESASPTSWRATLSGIGARVWRIATAVVAGREGPRGSYLQRRWRRVRSRLETRRWRRRNEYASLASRIAAGERLPIPEMLRHVRQANLLAYQHYRPSFYDGEVTLFYATQRDTADSIAAWRALAASVDVRPVPGNHTTILEEPNVRTLARELDAVLARVHEGPAGMAAPTSLAHHGVHG